MAASTIVSPREVVRVLQTLGDEKTRKLVFYLGVEMYVLDNIDCGYTAGNRSMHYIQVWLNTDTEASWEKIVAGLKGMGMNVLASNVAKQHCPQSPYVAIASSDSSQPASVLTTQPVTTPAPVTPAIPSSVATTSADDSEQSPNAATSEHTQSVAVDMRSVANVKATIRQLKTTFSNLITRTRSALCKKESQNEEFLDEFRDSLLVLPVAKKAAHVKFFRESEDDILEAKNIRKIFAILSRYLGYQNYEILYGIVDLFCDGVRGSINEYCESLMIFERTTTVYVYLAAIPNEKSGYLENKFATMIVKIDKPAAECTLYDIRKLNEAIIEGSSLHSYSVYIGGVADKCVEVVVRFPSSAVGWVLSAMTPVFMKTHLLTEVALDNEQLTIIEAEKKELNTQLIVASRAGEVVRVESLLNSGADVDSVGGWDSASALDTAGYKGHLQVVRLLMSRGSNVECRDKHGWTPLITAAQNGKCDVVIDLLDSGADINAQKNDGNSALMRAAGCGNFDIIQKLVKANAKLDLQNKSGDSALMKAARFGKIDIVRDLAGAGAQLDLQNMNGDSAAIMATINQRSNVLRVLVDAGSDLNVQNEEGLTAVMISARSGRSDITDILVEGEHIDLDIQENSTGWSALHFAAERGDVTTTKSLLKAGANALLKDKNGLTALEVATASGSFTAGVCALLAEAMPHHLPRPDTEDDVDHSGGVGSLDSSLTKDDTTVEVEIPTTGQQRQGRVSQALRSLVKNSVRRLDKLFNNINKRLRSGEKLDSEKI